MTRAAAVMVCGGEKKLFLRFLNFDVWQGGRLSGRPFCSRRIPRVRFLSEQSYFIFLLISVMWPEEDYFCDGSSPTPLLYPSEMYT
jgi:hypothetical protein